MMQILFIQCTFRVNFTAYSLTYILQLKVELEVTFNPVLCGECDDLVDESGKFGADLESNLPMTGKVDS